MKLVGVYLDGPFAEISSIKKGQDLQVEELKTFLVPLEKKESSLLKKLISEKDVKQLYTHSFKGKFLSALSSQDFLTRSILEKQHKEKYKEERILFESSAFSPFNSEEVIHFPVLSSSKEQGLLLTIFKKKLTSHLESLKKVGIEPDRVSVVPEALCQYVTWKWPDLENAFIIHLGWSEIHCCLIENKKLQKAQVLLPGIEKLFFGLQQDTKPEQVEELSRKINLFKLSKKEFPQFYEALHKLKEDLAKFHYSFCKDAKRKVVFTGRVDSFLQLCPFLDPTVEKEPSKEKKAFQEPSSLVEEKRFAISIGLCLEEQSKKPIQLLRGEFFPKKISSQIRWMMLILLTLSISLSSLFVVLGFYSIEKQTKEMLESIPINWKGHFQDSLPLEKKIASWISSVKKESQRSSYLFDMPSLSKVLQHLSKVQKQCEENGKIDLLEISYQKSTNTKSKNLIEVHADFAIENPKIARKLYEALKEEKSWIDSKTEVRMDPMGEKIYRAQFLLKTKKERK